MMEKKWSAIVAVEPLRQCCVASDELAMLWRSGTNAGRSVQKESVVA